MGERCRAGRSLLRGKSSISLRISVAGVLAHYGMHENVAFGVYHPYGFETMDAVAP
jgi:hypothetical protein